jgi:hypothetical protein
VITFIFVWCIIWADCYYYIFNQDKSDAPDEEMHVINALASIISFSTGIFLTIIRINEPYFRFLVKK